MRVMAAKTLRTQHKEHPLLFTSKIHLFIEVYFTIFLSGCESKSQELLCLWILLESWSMLSATMPFLLHMLIDQKTLLNTHLTRVWAGHKDVTNTSPTFLIKTGSVTDLNSTKTQLLSSSFFSPWQQDLIISCKNNYIRNVDYTMSVIFGRWILH